jgi:hypothetical protein
MALPRSRSSPERGEQLDEVGHAGEVVGVAGFGLDHRDVDQRVAGHEALTGKWDEPPLFSSAWKPGRMASLPRVSKPRRDDRHHIHMFRGKRVKAGIGPKWA